jgi:hypothetical protein
MQHGEAVGATHEGQARSAGKGVEERGRPDVLVDVGVHALRLVKRSNYIDFIRIGARDSDLAGARAGAGG